MSVARREFSGNAVPTTITGTIDNDDLAISIALATGWPTGATGPFIVTIDQGLASEEKIEVASRAGLVLTVTATGRGHDGTAAVGHGASAPIEHTLAARDLREANTHIADPTQDDHTQYLDVTRHAGEDHAIDTAELVDGSVTAAKLEAAQQSLPGDFKWGIQAASHTGWLLCNGAAVAQVTYANLFAVMGGHIFGADPGGGNFLLPDLRKKMLMGKAAAGVGSTLGGSGGTADAAAVAHAHTVDPHSHGGVSGGQSVDHAHNASHAHSGGVNSIGDHDHDAALNQFVITNAGGPYAVPSSNPAGQQVTFTTETASAGGHDHEVTVDVNNFSTAGASVGHTHTVAAESPGTNIIGATGVDQNLPPFMAVNGFIHT